LFLVPKYRVNSNGEVGDFNDVRCTGIEHKMGLHGSPTCSISYGDHDHCVGELVGELNQGLMAMFVLMNEARLSCGLQGVALGELGYQSALEYAKERTQGTNVHGEKVNIIEHADVKRMLLEMRSETFALRALGYQIAAQIDRAESTHEKAVSSRIALLTPIFKAFATERANYMSGQVVQVFGGMGVVEETGVAQIMRDARITTIYEGTTGIQARDLLMRKVRGDQGEALRSLLDEIDELAKTLTDERHLADMVMQTRDAVVTIRQLLDRVLLKKREDLTLLHGISVPFLEAMGTLCCAWQLLNVISEASKHEVTDTLYHKNVISTAQFYGAFRLPQVMALLKTVQSDALGFTTYDFNA